MDGRNAPSSPPSAASPPSPPTPYRDGKPLAEIIPRDRRREKAAALILASMVAGAALWVLGGWAIDALRVSVAEPVTQTTGHVTGRVPKSVLSGPGGSFAMPPPKRSVVHVWLQGCADCMPAFEAMRELQSHGGLAVDAPIINVAYGEADPTWADRYSVATNLVFDPGGAKVVRPLGIGSFTTLVVEPNGTIIHRDRPDRPGYAARVRSAVRYGNPSVMEAPDPNDPLGQPGDATEAPPPVPDMQALDSAAVERVVTMHRAAIKRTCWDRRARGSAPSSVSATVALTVATDGRVSESSAQGDDPAIAACLAAQTRTWRFPTAATPTSLTIPFKFVQE